MSDLIRVGLVGVGIISETHLKVLAEHSRVSLEFTVDLHVGESPEFRGIKPPHFGALPAALEEHPVDLIVIATPTDTHEALAAQALTLSTAQVLVEKPLVQGFESLARLGSLNGTVDVRGRLFTAHHFAFSPEVRWAAEKIAEHPQWGPVTGVTSAFYDPYVLRGEQAFASYVSSWMDSGVNQLSMLTRFVDLVAVTSAQQMDGGASAWHTFEYRSRGAVGTARLFSSWLTGSSSKETTLTFGHAGVEIWIDHTAMTGFAAHDGKLLATYGSDGRTPRKIAHYRPLYASLLSGQPDPILSFDTAVAVTQLHDVRPAFGPQ